MKALTKYHGEVDIILEEIIHFEKGIPGFGDEKEFVVLPLSDDKTFLVLQSVKNQYLAFVITNPFHFFKEYDFQMEDAEVKELGINDEKEVVVYSILTVQDPFGKTTANLQAPLIVNSSNRKAKQIILNDSELKTKHPIFHGASSVPSKG
ncbi:MULTISPECIES: flagellar assembly protein FliW [unclassified Bacillus (in: firmicutes)]|uniref:flagellar assembly protein FliW n=1 Tax=unclassified Bacillus (in: firmicutes) TaxID=185979 RepID=UPI0008ED5123|nr:MULTISPECIES: flagellar assembly protein FliW [unclassified Bacillus (in: firmicutes)]SFB25295.1 flagellar assembly factor FliW [Bacillus sp. UNCCL13]SFQ91686.1 flagellar assembly factor FliW [Bacillus sp. cl95]